MTWGRVVICMAHRLLCYLANRCRKYVCIFHCIDVNRREAIGHFAAMLNSRSVCSAIVIGQSFRFRTVSVFHCNFLNTHARRLSVCVCGEEKTKFRFLTLSCSILSIWWVILVDNMGLVKTLAVIALVLASIRKENVEKVSSEESLEDVDSYDRRGVLNTTRMKAH